MNDDIRAGGGDDGMGIGSRHIHLYKGHVSSKTGVTQIGRGYSDARSGHEIGNQVPPNHPTGTCDKDMCHRAAGRLERIMASVSPEIACQIPQKAATTAMPPSPPKNPKMRTKPRPEF